VAQVAQVVEATEQMLLHPEPVGMELQILAVEEVQVLMSPRTLIILDQAAQA
jgi:hypothetical protein